jgi:hypothetical protein
MYQTCADVPDLFARLTMTSKFEERQKSNCSVVVAPRVIRNRPSIVDADPTMRASTC